jgi:hypothetical protein
MSLNLDQIVDVIVKVTSTGATTSTFNQGLIIGTSSIIPTLERAREYTEASSMLTDGFTVDSPEYKAALMYFNADSQPNVLWVGRQDLSALVTLAINAGGTGYNVNDVLTITQSGASGGTATVTAIDNGSISGVAVDVAGTGYAVGDVLTIVQSGATGGTLTVTSVNVATGVTGVSITTAGADYNTATGLATTVSPTGATGCTITITAIDDGAVSAVSLTTVGTGYTVGTGLATTVAPTGGSSCTINVTAIGETAVDAVSKCRAASMAWYACYVCGAALADHVAIAATVESMTPNSQYIYDTHDAAAVAGTAASTNVFYALNAAAYKRSMGIYSTTNYAGAALLGEAMGLTTLLENSAYTMKFKTLTGVTVEPITQTQVTNIEKYYGNVYVNYAAEYNIFEQGYVSNGYYFDQILFRDVLQNYIQIEVMNLLVSNSKIALTDAGVTAIMNVVNTQCSALQSIGYIAPSGTWDGVAVLNLKYGDTMANGYLTQARKVSTLTTSQRIARQSPPIYVALVEASAIHSVTIAVYVQS